MNGQIRKRKMFDKPLCKYGVSCYQKNPEHRKKFKHPSKDNDELNIVPLSADSGISEEDSKTDTDSQNSTYSVIQISDEESVSDTTVSQNATSDDLENEVDSGTSSLEETVGEILQSMPKDFFDFWKFCVSISKSNPQSAFSDIGYKLVGIYDLLSKKLPSDRKVDISCHWRYFYDPPEFQTVIRKTGKDLYHIGYFRDVPSEKPSILASNSAALGEKLTLMGDNIFCAMNIELKKLKTSDSKIIKKIVSQLQQKLLKFAAEKNYSTDLQTNKTKQRQKKVVAKTFHGLGIVVPLKNDVGYRPLPETNASLRKILKKIVTAENEQKRLDEEEHLDEIIANVNYANDECDYGMGFELGIDLFCFGDTSLHKITLHLLTLAYDLLQRTKYASILKAHLKNRKKDSPLITLNI